MLNKEQIQALSKNDKILVHYLFLNPELTIRQNERNPNSRFNPIEHTVEAVVIQNGANRLRIEFTNGKKLTIEHESLDGEGTFGCDSIYYRRFSPLY